MRARIKPSAITTKTQRRAIQENVRDELQRQQKDNTRRLFKLMCVSLHEEFGFGHDRCVRLLERINTLSAEHQHDEAFWYHIDTVIHNQIGLDFANENYDEFDR